MPDMDGFEATGAIRRLERVRLSISPSSSAHPPSSPGSRPDHRALIVALTGLGSARAQDKAYKAGVDLFITKPVRFGELTKLLSEWEQGLLVGGRSEDNET
jgi:CheY-like chemotaxis protein